MKLSASGATHPGRVRIRNEDAFYVGPGLYVVCDGMGGGVRGDEAAEVACATVADLWMESATSTTTVERLRGIVEVANEAVYALAYGSNMGTTIVALAIENGRGAVAWVGDSRLGRLRGGRFEWLTEDHSVQADLDRAARDRGEEPRKVRGVAHIVTRALGRASVKVDAAEVDVRVGDVFLLCSDGVWGELEDPRIKDLDISPLFGIASRAAHPVAPTTPEDVARSFVSLALEFGGRDNATAIVLRVEE